MHILYLPLQTLFGAINAAARVVDQRAVDAEVTHRRVVGWGGGGVARWELRKSGIIISFLIIQDRSETLIKSVTNKNTAPTPRLDGHFAAICHSKGANLAPAKHLPSTPPSLPPIL